MGSWLCKHRLGYDITRSLSTSLKETSEQNAALIFLHGLGDTGHSWAHVLKKYVPSHCKIICPNAKAIPVSLNGGGVMPAWYDIQKISPDAPQDEIRIKEATENLEKIVKLEVSKGILPGRIFVGGFSQGGSIALFYGLTQSEMRLAGIVALSSWLPLHNSFIHNPAFVTAPKSLPILQCHGLADSLVPYQLGDMTHDLLLSFGMQNMRMERLSGLGHSYSDEELLQVKEFMLRTLV